MEDYKSRNVALAAGVYLLASSGCHANITVERRGVVDEFLHCLAVELGSLID